MEKNENRKTLSEFPKYDENPFVAKDMFKNCNSMSESKRFRIIPDEDDENTGISKLTSGNLSIKFKTPEGVYFAKLYEDGFLKLPNLNNCGLKIFSLFFNEMPYNKAEVFLFKDNIMRTCGWSSLKPYYQGLASLVGNEFLACSHSPNKFFINPSMVFKGDRTSLIKQGKNNIPDTLDEQGKNIK